MVEEINSTRKNTEDVTEPSVNFYREQWIINLFVCYVLTKRFTVVRSFPVSRVDNRPEVPRYSRAVTLLLTVEFVRVIPADHGLLPPDTVGGDSFRSSEGRHYSCQSSCLPSLDEVSGRYRSSRRYFRHTLSIFPLTLSWVRLCPVQLTES